MSSDESFTSREYDTPDRSQHSSPLLDDCDDDEFENTPSKNRRRILLEKLPSPREFKSPPEKIPSPPPKKFVSISELNPFFDELDTTCSSTSSVADDGERAEDSHDLRAPFEEDRQDRVSSPESRKADEPPLCRRTSSFRKIWSSLGSSNLPGLPSAVLTKSQESCYSSSGSINEGLDKSKKTIKNRLRHVSNKVRKQFSITSGFISEKLANKHSVKSDSSMEAFPGESREYHENQLRTASPELSPPDQPTHTPVSHSKIEINDLQSLEECKERKSSALSDCSGYNKETVQIEPAKLIWSIPNWTDNDVITACDNNSLEEEVEKEKRAIALKQPIEWAESIEFLRKSVGRDFRRGYLALGEKVKNTNG